MNDAQAKKIVEKNTQSDEKVPSLRETIVFAFPQMLIMVSYLLLSFTDLWVAGKLSSTVQASLGIVGQVDMFLTLLLSFFISGFTTTIAQCLGARKNLRASRYIVSAISICLIAGGFIALLSIVMSKIILNYIAMNDKELEAIIYTFVLAYSCKLPFFSLKGQINSIFRAYKKTKIPVIATFILCGTNFICSVGFGLGYFGFPAYGYAGIAWSTVFSAIVACIYLLYEIWRAKILSRQSFTDMKWKKKALPYVFGIGIPTAASSLISQSGGIVIMAMLLTFSGTTNALIAGYTLGMRVQSILQFIVGAFTISVSVLSGRLMGARKFDAIYTLGVKTAGFAFGLSLFLAGMTYFFGYFIVNALSDDAQVRVEALYYLKFICIMQPAFGINAIIMGVFTGVGASRINAIIAAVTTWCISIPIAYIFGVMLDYGAVAIYNSFVVRIFATTFIIGSLFYQRKWDNYGLIKGKKPREKS